jgi:hypothetical protein
VYRKNLVIVSLEGEQPPRRSLLARVPLEILRNFRRPEIRSSIRDEEDPETSSELGSRAGRIVD